MNQYIFLLIHQTDQLQQSTQSDLDGRRYSALGLILIYYRFSVSLAVAFSSNPRRVCRALAVSGSISIKLILKINGWRRQQQRSLKVHPSASLLPYSLALLEFNRFNETVEIV